MLLPSAFRLERISHAHPINFVKSQLNSHAFLCSYLLQLIAFYTIHHGFDFVASVMEKSPCSDKFTVQRQRYLLMCK